MVRRVLLFPLTRLLIAVGLYFAIWWALDIAYAAVLGLPPGAIVDRTFVTIAALVALVVAGRIVGQRRLSELGFPGRHAARDLGLGLLVGAVLLTGIFGVMALAGWYRVSGFLWDQSTGTATYVAFVGLLYYALVAVSEEVLFRGIGFRIVEEGLGTWVAIGISALIFGLFHLGNPNATLWSALALALESGVLFGAGFILTRGLLMPIGLHLTWNYFLGSVYGAAVSGSSQSSLLVSRISGPDLWTGGAFGPEAGLVAVIVCGVPGALALVLCARQGKILVPAWLSRRDGGEALAADERYGASRRASVH